MKRLLILGLLLLVAVVVTACSGVENAPAAVEEAPVVEASSEESNDADMMKDESDDEMMEEASDEDMMEEESDDEMMKEESDDEIMKDESDDDMMKEESDDAMMKDESDDEMMEESHDDGMMEDDSGDEMMKDESSDEEMMEDSTMMGPDWFSAQLTDVNSGTPFSIVDHQNKVILVETIAVWCSNCLRQQREVQALHEILGARDDFVSLALDIDIRETAEILKSHAEGNGFDWLYAVAPQEVAREIGQLYGDQFLSPPSTPMLIIDRHGEVHPLPFGIKSADDLQAALEPFLNDSM